MTRHPPHTPDSNAAQDPWTPMRLIALGVVTLAVAFSIINYISDLGLKAAAQ